jgi:RNA 2',3'-cyclic 3'-phosphodiesterase
MAGDESNRGGAARDERGASLRLFFAVELPREVREAAAAHAARLRRDFPAVRASWPSPESFHLTLKFLGGTDAARVETLSRVAASAAAGLAPFTLTIEGAGAFPPRGAARVLWLGVRDDTGQLSRLQRRLEDECAAAGFPREPRPYNPHLTLARLRAPHDAAALSEAHRRTPFGPHTFQVSDFVLMRSELGRGGPRYTPIQRHSL